MAGQTTGLQKAYRVDDPKGIRMYRGVVRTGNGGCKESDEAGALPLGVVTNDERIEENFSATGDQTGKHIAVQLSGIAEIKMNGAIEEGDIVMLTEEGMATKAEGEVNTLGIAEKDGEDGDVIPVLINIQYNQQ